MKKSLCLFCFILAGCTQQQPLITDLNLGMQIFEVRDVHKAPLAPVASQPAQIYDLVQYRGWFFDGTERKNIFGKTSISAQPKPYKLTFELYPPVTQEQCQLLAVKHNVTDPNELAGLMSIKGLRPSRLIQIKLDEAALHRQAINRQTAAMRAAAFQNQMLQQQQLQQLQNISWNQQQMLHIMEFNRTQRGW